jgi:hypothetical protein
MPRTHSAVNTLPVLLASAFGKPIDSLSVREMELNGWAALNGRVFPRWTCAGGPRRSYDPTLAALASVGPAKLPALTDDDLESFAEQMARHDREHAAWMRAEGFEKYPASVKAVA